MRTKKAIFNYITDVVPMIILMFLGLIKIDFFIHFLGAENNGLYNLYSQIMAYLTIVDGGLTSAMLYRMYAPIASKDYEYISSLLNGSKRIFNIIGVSIFALGVVVSFLISYLVKDNTFEFAYLQSTFLLYLVGGVIPYFCVISKTILEAHQEKYISNIIVQGVAIVKGILEIVFLLKGGNLYSIILLYTLSSLISSIIIYVVVKKKYSYILLKSQKPSYEILKDVKDLMIHKIGTLVAYNIDTLVISVLKGLAYVTVYTSYNYIVNNLTNLLGKISYSAIAGVGDLLQVDKERAYNIFREFNALSFFFAIVICIPLLLVINPFIDIWLGEKIETTFLLALAFTLNLYYYLIRMPLITYVNSAGLFRETRMLPIIEIVTNLSLSLILVKRLGVAGVLIATFIAYLVSDYFFRPVIIYKNIFNKAYVGYYTNNTMFVVFSFLNYGLCAFVFQNLSNKMTNYFSWFLCSTLIFSVNFVLTVFEFHFTGNLLFEDRIKRYINQFRNKN